VSLTELSVIVVFRPITYLALRGFKSVYCFDSASTIVQRSLRKNAFWSLTVMGV